MATTNGIGSVGRGAGSRTAPLLRPARALLHPLSLTATAFIILELDVLAAMMPAAATVLAGRLVDFAWLLIVPTVLALLCQARSHRGVALAHLLTGGLYATVVLLEPLRAQWVDVLASVGLDPVPPSLWPLASLLPSWWYLRPMMGRQLAHLRWDQMWRGTAGAVVMVCCIAASTIGG